MVTEVRIVFGGGGVEKGGNGIWVFSEKGYERTFQGAGTVLYLNLKVVIIKVYTDIKKTILLY